MPSIYGLKPAFQRLLRPITNGLAHVGVTANQITLAAMMLSFSGGASIIFFPNDKWPLVLIGPVLFVRMALNAIDGMLAREHNMKTNLGAFLNELGDVLSDAALFLPLATRPGIDPFLLVPAVVLGIVSEMAGVVGVQVGSERRYDGPMGKSDRAFIFGLLAILLGCGVPPGLWITLLLGIVIALLILTICNRVRMALRKGN